MVLDGYYWFRNPTGFPFWHLQHPPTQTVGFSATFLQSSAGWTRGFKTPLGVGQLSKRPTCGRGLSSRGQFPSGFLSFPGSGDFFLGVTKNGSAFRSPFPFTQVALKQFWIGKISGSGWENNCFWDGTAYRSGFGSGFSLAVLFRLFFPFRCFLTLLTEGCGSSNALWHHLYSLFFIPFLSICLSTVHHHCGLDSGGAALDSRQPGA